MTAQSDDDIRRVYAHLNQCLTIQRRAEILARVVVVAGIAGLVFWVLK